MTAALIPVKEPRSLAGLTADVASLDEYGKVGI